jgi:serine/threonine protein kinase HipA of HipAB toxin-antitoxin module
MPPALCPDAADTINKLGLIFRIYKVEVIYCAEHPASDQRLFMLSQLVFWMLAASGGHAKNFSIHHRRGGGFGLTPLYDVLWSESVPINSTFTS